jgi:hypothetical protein
VFKLLPGIFAIWLILKRQWAAVAAWVVTVLVVALLPSLVVFGPRGTLEYHRQWWDFNVRGAAARGMIDAHLRSHFIDHRNQSISAVVARLCWSEHPRAAKFQPLKLDERACRRVSQGLAIVLAIGLVWMTRRAAPSFQRQNTSDGVDGNRGRIEAAVYLLAMLVFSPLLRTYYLVWALPGLALLTCHALDDRARLSQRLGQIGLALWLVGMLAWLSDSARASGVHLIMLIALGAVLLRLSAQQVRRSG